MWRRPNARRVILARFISRSGGFAAFFVGIWGKAAFEFEATPGELVVVMVALGVSNLVGASAAGVLTDRYDPKRVMIWGEIAFVPAALSVILAGDMTQLAFTAGLLGLTGAPVFTAAASFAPYLTDDEGELKSLNIALETAAMSAIIAGPALGAIVESVWSLDWVFVLDAVTSLVALGLVLRVEVRELEAGERKGAFAEALEGFGYAYRRRPLRYIVLMASVVWLSFGTFGALEPLFFRDVVGAAGPEVLGWVNMVFGFGLVAGAVSLSRLPEGLVSGRGLATITALNGGGALLYVSTGNILVVLAGAIVWGFLIGLLVPIVRTMLHLNSPEELVGRITGVAELHHQGGELLPLAFVAPLASWLGVQTVLIASAIVVLSVAVLSYLEGAAVDRVQAAEPETLTPAEDLTKPYVP